MLVFTTTTVKQRDVVVKTSIACVSFDYLFVTILQLLNNLVVV